jgi:N-succinyldiaminopimelate aminotransferase
MAEWEGRASRYQVSVFEEFNAIAQQCGAVNLVSGTPDLALPGPLASAAAAAIAGGHNQYSEVRGERGLREAIAGHALRFYSQNVDPESEVMVTNGVTEAMQAALFTFVEPGDEVIVFEPFYDSYGPCIEMAGGRPVAVTLRAPGYRFDPEELRAAFSKRTKAIVVNSPHNPTGIVFSRSELEQIAKLCQAFDALAITDEVYEHIVFDGVEPQRLATIDGMWERTLTLSGAGKTFSCTGWRIGWAIGPARLLDEMARLRQFTVFCAATPLQLAVAEGLRFDDGYFEGLAAEYQRRRDLLAAALRQCGLEPSTAQGSFFLLSEITKITELDGREFCRELARGFGVAPAPADTFYLDPGRGRRIIRFTFCARPEILEAAAARLAEFSAERGAGIQ